MERPTSYFGHHVFNEKTMRERLPQDVFEQLTSTINGGQQKLDSRMADVVAAAMKEWAISLGATHYAHWFHPRTELTAEKHMAFLSVDERGTPLEAFTGGELIQSEPDASSLPSGGTRSTFEARGYTAWDPTSPAFIIPTENGGTLCIPSVFLSWDGTPLDMKTPLLKAITAIEERAMRMLRLFGNRGIRWVKVTVGAEQEFFLIDEELARKRPDLVLCGRTVIGCLPPKGQQLEDHYFGVIHPRVLAYMEETEQELHKLGIAIKTRHDEVAPCQFEFAPQFTEANLATDQNQITMSAMKRIARRHGLRLLLHEKPFAVINGSGKHTNFSLMDSDGHNLLEPSTSQRRNVQFLAFLGALLLGVSKYSSLLRASVASPGNMHRLGGNEAPPAIMSVYLGNALTDVLNRLEEGFPDEIPTKGLMDLGLNKLPSIKKENSDRNRTAPLAFTGNKFEFRATGASQSIAGPLTMLLTIWAWGIKEVTNRIESRLGNTDIADATLDVLRDVAKESMAIRFEGNCYDPEWHEEARRRGLPIANTTPEALFYYLIPENRDLLSGLNVMTDREITAYYETRLEQYVKTVDVEMAVMDDMIRHGILPSISRQIIQEGSALEKAASLLDDGLETWKGHMKTLCGIKEALLQKLEELKNFRKKVKMEELEESASFITEEGLKLMNEIRSLSDAAESWIADDLQPFPPYRDLLVIH
ncbi:MAG TPA: glutamine synthetase III [Thermosynergistes sp.]|nr:glutamine synthetase III [Thermosynergistes sp.]HPZ76715.1 glutamine synthetase III [Thermosynergistes sp.]HQE21024.1 glutamine synthetase III [Thermosynergistes sp.]